MSITDKGSIYDRIINEEWMSTPDMGEYINNKIFKENIDGLSDKSGAEYYVENPPVENPGYNDQLKVVAIRCNKAGILEYMGDFNTDNNTYDGDTIRLSLGAIQDTTERFQVHYDNLNIYNGVKDYLKRTLKLVEPGQLEASEKNFKGDTFDIRFVGINAPEIIHYAEKITNRDGSDIFETTYKDIKNSMNTVEFKSKGLITERADKSLLVYSPFVVNEAGEYKERNDDDVIRFAKFYKSEELYPNVEGDRLTYNEVVNDLEFMEGINQKRRIVASVDHDIFTKGIEYSIQAKKAQRLVKETIESAEDIMIVLDTIGLNGAKKEIAPIYKKSYEKSTYNPFYALWDMWKSVRGVKAAYKYASYQAPGIEANGRFLGAVYVKVKHNGSSVWINLNKKVAFENDLVETNPDYSSSPDSMADYHYLSDAFRLWTYDYKNRIFVDDLNEEVMKTKDDRARIQKEICGCELDEMTDHTLMIGDCMFMIPPTSIKMVSQTKTSKTHLIRAKGSIQKTLPKSERIIQLDLYFNGDQGINGIPIKQKLPNGMEKIYMMNGLRSLIAQFKLTPFMPIHNKYINEILNIDAVALASYTINTMPNYPRTLQVTLMMYEFEWRQYMPSQSVPDVKGSSIYRNLFSDTIHFPLLRYYYQQAIERGDDLKNGDLKAFKPNTPEYIKATIGNRTALQPMDFMHPLFDLYVPDEDTLSVRKQLKVAMATRPLGQTFNFNEKQKDFMSKMFEMDKVLTATDNTIMPLLYKIKASNPNFDIILNGNYVNEKKEYALASSKILFNEVILNKSKNSVEKYIKDDSWSKKILSDIQLNALDIFNKSKLLLGNSMIGVDSKISCFKEKNILYVKIDINYIINEGFFDLKSDLDLIKTFCGKYGEIDADLIFKDNKMQLTYVAEFTDSALSYMNQPFVSNNSESWAAVRFMGTFSEFNSDGTTSFSWDKVLNSIKDSMDIEDEYSIKYNKFSLGDETIGYPIITNMSSSYNNIFANIALKAIDGHAAQYTGGSDSVLNIEMIGNDEMVARLQLLNRKCVDYLIEYRRVLTSSPLRIDSDLTRMLGIYEVIIESLEIDTIPEYPGKFKINLRLNSVDRTLRNKESLSRIKDLDNSNTQKDTVINTKSFFDLKEALGKAEIYPDLELPTVVELEKAGFYFLKNKYTPERVYVDPDFYFLYWYPTFAENLRTSITEYFSDPQNLKYTLSDNLFKESIDLELKVTNGNGQSFYEVMGWEENESYNKMIEDIRQLNVIVDKNGNPDKEANELLADLTVAKLAEIDKKNKEIAKLQEVIDMSIDQAHLVNSLTNICVKDYDVMDVASESEKLEIKKINEKLRKKIAEFLEEPLKIKTTKNHIYSNNPNTHPQKTFTFKTSSIDTDANNTVVNKHEDFIKEIFKIILNTDKDIRDINRELDFDYLGALIKAGAVGEMAKLPAFFGANKDLMDTLLSGEKQFPSPYLPEVKANVQLEDGTFKDVPICLYPSAEAGELLIAHDKETRERGILFGPAGIKKFDGSQLGALFKRPGMNDGFLDPYYNKDLYYEIFDKAPIGIDFDDRIDAYLEGVMEDPEVAQEAHFRQMLVWLYILTKNETFITSTHYYASKVYGMIITQNPRASASLAAKFMTTDTLDTDTEEEDSVTNIPYKDKKIRSYKKEINSVFGDNAYENMDETSKEQDEIIKQFMAVIADSGVKYITTLLHGIFYSLSMIAMGGPSSSFLSSTCDGVLSGVSDIVQKALGTSSLDDLSEEEKKYTRFVQYCNLYLDEDKRYQRTDYQRTSYNNKIQRAYLKAANDPKVYMLHSFYDMVMNDKRGQMGRAFPTYYMLLIDEGREIGFWKLQDNFYDMNSIIEFEVVKSRKIAADTARIVMSNLHGVFNSDDEDMKDEVEYTMRDVFDSVFSPRKYFNKEYDRRKNARDINSAKMQPGARVHLRMGYGSNAAELPIVFNGSVAEFENGEVMTLICQGDGVELSNPHMFNALDCKDVEDIQYSDAFMGYKSFLQTWNNLSTPRSLLVNPLAAEGTWIQEMIRKYSSGRFFNSNPFGIVHFGDRKFTDIFAANGEVEQNIYEGMSSPTWDYGKSGMKNNINDGLIREYAMMEAPKVRVGLNQGFSFWDIMHIAASISPDFISAIAPFQLRSTVFHGHPRYYYAYDYIKVDGRIVEKRKPYQQYHVYTSYGDIIANNISTSSKDVRTNAIGHYIGPSWLSTEPKTVGPLFVDIDIFPEYQKSTSVNLNFEYKSQELVPFTIPIKDKLSELDWTGKKMTGEKIAWRATANALKDTIKDMYQGELIVMGDPTVKPFDRMTISDIYEDIAGNAEVETVVHMFSVETGFTTSITPDCISCIDNTYDTMGSAVTSQAILPALAADTLLVAANLNFHKHSRTMYLSMSRMSKHGANAVMSLYDNAKTLIGKEALSRETLAISSAMPEALKNILFIDDKDIKLYDLAKELVKGNTVFNKTSITSSKAFSTVIKDFDKLDDIFNSVNVSNYDELVTMLGDSRYSKTSAEVLKNLKDKNIASSISSAIKDSVFSAEETSKIYKALDKLPEADKTKEVLDIMNLAKGSIDPKTKEGKEFLKALSKLGDTADNFTGAKFGDVAKVLEEKSSAIKAIFNNIDEVDDVVDVVSATKTSLSGLTLGKAGAAIANGLVMLAVELCVTKSAQEFLTRKLRNLQVLTIYPLKKNELAWTAGLNGHQGSVVGSLSYDEPGWLESMAIKFFEFGGEYGSEESWLSPKKWLAILRDSYITTDEMRNIVNKYKRGNDYAEESQIKTKEEIEAANSLGEKLAKQTIQTYSTYKKLFLTERLTANQLSDNQDMETRTAYATYKITSPHIESDKNIDRKLDYVLDNTELVDTLYKNKGLYLAYDYNVDNKNSNVGIKEISIPYESDESKAYYVRSKIIPAKTTRDLDVYDIPFLRPDAMIVFNQFVQTTLKHIQPDYTLPNCKFEKIKEHPIILHSATKINSSDGWRSTGFLFTVEVKNYKDDSNIIDDVIKEEANIAKEIGRSDPFSVQKEFISEYGANAYTFFVHCPKV